MARSRCSTCCREHRSTARWWPGAACGALADLPGPHAGGSGRGAGRPVPRIRHHRGRPGRTAGAGSLGGLWLMLIGWFLTSAARAEETATVANSALAGLRVADVMILDPDIGHGWSTVQDFIDQVAAHSRQGAFPVVGFGGELAGVVVSGLLGRIRLADRPVLRIDQLARTRPSGYLATLGDPAGPLLTRPPMASEVVAVVLAQGRVVGLVTAGDLSQAVRRSRLRAGPGGWPVGGPTARDSAGK